ncbi:MAG: ECF transporter S component [Lentisphaeria bacterium]
MFTAAVVVVYVLLNTVLRLHLPGVSNVDLRPQIVLIFVIGYLYGPGYGFLAGVAGNFGTDILLGYGVRYLPSWTVGNGLFGALIGFFPYRKERQLDRIGQLVGLASFLILVNVVALTYAAGMEHVLDRQLPSIVNFRYFYLPALLSNVLSTLLLFPAVLFFLRRLKPNYPVKLALGTYYLTAVLLIASWITFLPSYLGVTAVLHSADLDLAQGNALVEAFNHWALLLVILLVLSFLAAGWMLRTLVTPIKRLETAVFAVLKGDPSSADQLGRLAKREDEIGILSYAVRLLSEKLWETQKLSQNELEKRLRFLDARDSGTDIFLVALISIFGKDALGDPTDAGAASETTGDLSNLAAISRLLAACGLKELAATYSEAKIEKSFSNLDLRATDAAWSREERQALALAIDLNLLFKGRLKVLDLHAPLSRELAFHLLERARSFVKSSKNYIGYVTELDIVSKVCDRWEKAGKIRNDTVERVMRTAISQRVITGYQIKKRDSLAQFDANLEIVYSHSSVRHLKQVIGLLMGEALQAKLQLEPKHSVFYYRQEWEKTPELALESLDGGATWVAHKDEFDLVLEFTAPEFRDRFRQVIEAHAKREFTGGQKVLVESWYQPLYHSVVPLDGYVRIADVMLRAGTHIVQTYVKEDEMADVQAWFKAALPGLEVSSSAIWVNAAFFRYLNGGSAD